jgi:transposase-like protein
VQDIKKNKLMGVNGVFLNLNNIIPSNLKIMKYVLNNIHESIGLNYSKISGLIDTNKIIIYFNILAKKYKIKNSFSKYYLDDKFYKKDRRGQITMYLNSYLDNTINHKIRKKIEKQENEKIHYTEKIKSIKKLHLNNISVLDPIMELKYLLKYRVILNQKFGNSKITYKLPQNVKDSIISNI